MNNKHLKNIENCMKAIKAMIAIISVMSGVIAGFLLGHDKTSFFASFFIFSGLTGYTGYFLYELFKTTLRSEYSKDDSKSLMTSWQNHCQNKEGP